MRAHAATRWMPLLLLALVATPGCGVASSIAEDFIDDEQVTLFVAVDRSGTIVRTEEGQDLDVRPGSYSAGDTLTGDHALSVLAFRIDASQVPDRVKLKRALLIYWSEPESGDPTPLGPIVTAHLPDHPNFPLVAGQVPHPAGNPVAEQGDLGISGWRRVDVTQAVAADFAADRPVSAFAVRLATTTNGDFRADTLALIGTDVHGNTARAHLVLDFGADL